MEIVVKSYWYTLEPVETEAPGETVEDKDQAPGGADPVETVDPDFTEVSELLREGNDTASPTPSESLSPSPEVETEVIDYVPYLENITIQLGVIDIVLVLALLISVIKQFVRVPR